MGPEDQGSRDEYRGWVLGAGSSITQIPLKFLSIKQIEILSVKIRGLSKKIYFQTDIV